MSECVDGGVRVPGVHSDERQGERGTFSSVTSIDRVKSMGVLMRSCCSCGDQSPAAVDLSLQARYRHREEQFFRSSVRVAMVSIGLCND